MLTQFGVFADMHYADPALTSPYSPQSLAKLDACLRHFNAKNIAYAFNLGDTVEQMADIQLKRAGLEKARQVYDAFHGHLYFVVGNHDSELLTNEAYLAHSGSPYLNSYYSFDADQVRFVVLDGNFKQDGAHIVMGHYEWDNLWLPDTQLQWLEERTQTELPVIVLCHECLDDVAMDGVLDPHILRNAHVVRKIMERAGSVVGVLQGHCHPGRWMNINGIPYIAFTAMVIGDGQENSAFAVVTVRSDRTVAVEGHMLQTSIAIAPHVLTKDKKRGNLSRFSVQADPPKAEKRD